MALVEDGRVVAVRVHDGSPSHGDAMLPLVSEAFGEAGWSRSTVDRVAAGTGPGSFTGIRVGLALAKGIALGLDRPAVGIGALRAMCRAVPPAVIGPRCAALDGRRDELFVGTYDAAGNEIEAPRIVPRASTDWLARLEAIGGVLAGEIPLPSAFEGRIRAFRSELSDLPHAVGVALCGLECRENDAPAEPCYLRPADAIRPPEPGSSVSSKRER